MASELGRSEIRVCGPGELGRFLQTCFSAFGGTVDDESVARVAPVFEHDRLFLAIENGEPAGSAGTIGFQLSVPGGEVPCGAVTMVGVLPGHRRQGIFRRLMERVLEDARTREEPLSVLWSTEGDLYGRFGYGLAAVAARIDLERAHAAMRRERTAAVSVRLVDADEAVTAFPVVYDAVRAGTPGMASRSENWWRSWRLAGPPGAPASPPIFRALLEVDGRVEGYALYRIHGSWSLGSSTATLEILEAMGSTPQGTQEIWRFLLSLDLVERVRALHLPVDHSLPLLVREPARLQLTLTDALWVRLVDVAGAIGARSFALADEAVLDLSDALCPWNEGRWLLAADPGGATVEPTSREADLRLGVCELGSAYLGGVTFGQLVRAGLVEELRAGTAARLDAMFRFGPAPWCPEEF